MIGRPITWCLSAHPRVVNGAPSTNPRYLQRRPDLADPRDSYLAEIAARLEREIPAARPVYQPVNAVLAGRRNSPADPEERHAAAGGLRTGSLSGIARAVHGFRRQPHRQITRHHRFRKRRRANQGPVQCAVAGGGFKQRAGVGDCDRLRGVHHVGRLCGAELSRGSRCEPAGPRNLVPHAST